MKKVILTSAVVLTSIFIAQAQSNIYVDVNATGNNDGSTWANAFTHIDSAVANSVTGANGPDYILVKAGTYKQQVLISKSVKIYGGFNGTETSYTQADPNANPVIFDADMNGDDIAGNFVSNKSDNLSYHLNIQGNQTPITFEVRVEGITFKNAYRLQYSGSSLFFRANGYAIQASFKNCKWLQNCNASNGTNGGIGGGAINADANSGGSATLNVDKCWFEGNYDQGTATYGSAIATACYSNAKLTLNLTNSVFIENKDVTNNGASYVVYSALSSLGTASSESTGLVRNNTFYNNNNSKAMLLWNGSPGDLDCIFDRNIVSGGDSTMVIGNAATTGNTYYISINNNYLPANSISAYVGFGYVNNTLGTSPGFVNAPTKDFNLTAASPCLNVDPNLLWMPDNFDYAGNPRLSGTGVDMGAYEYNVPSNTCAITNVNVEGTACTSDAAYSVTLTVSYENEPTSGTLNVATFDFPITGSPQTVTLYNLSASNPGNMFTSQAFFTAEPACEYIMTNFWTIPDCSNVGIDELVNQNIVSVYPNPTNSVLNIEITESMNIRVVNLLGATVATQKLNAGKNTIAVSELHNGVYFIQSDKGGAVKFVKD